MLTCAEIGAMVDAFVDSELPAATLLEVARHAGQCPRCDGAVRDLLAVREAVAGHAERAVAGLDLSGVWSRIDAEIARTQARAAWRQRVEARRARLPRGLPLWGSVAAIAAGVAVFLRGPALQSGVQLAGNAGQPSAVRTAAKRLPNHVYIDRLAGKDIAVRREPKSGTTVIWVNHEVESSGW